MRYYFKLNFPTVYFKQIRGLFQICGLLQIDGWFQNNQPENEWEKEGDFTKYVIITSYRPLFRTPNLPNHFSYKLSIHNKSRPKVNKIFKKTPQRGSAQSRDHADF